MITTRQRRTPEPASAVETTAAALRTTLQDDALGDLVRLHLVSLLNTTSWCRFRYLRDALSLTDDRCRRHVRVLRAHGYVGIDRDAIGGGWIYLTALGAAQRDAQFAALHDLPSRARDHARATRTAQPGWFSAMERP
jgi:winged helix DNA-binding protein